MSTFIYGLLIAINRENRDNKYIINKTLSGSEKNS